MMFTDGGGGQSGKLCKMRELNWSVRNGGSDERIIIGTEREAIRLLSKYFVNIWSLVIWVILDYVCPLYHIMECFGDTTVMIEQYISIFSYYFKGWGRILDGVCDTCRCWCYLFVHRTQRHLYKFTEWSTQIILFIIEIVLFFYRMMSLYRWDQGDRQHNFRNDNQNLK